MTAMVCTDTMVYLNDLHLRSLTTVVVVIALLSTTHNSCLSSAIQDRHHNHNPDAVTKERVADGGGDIHQHQPRTPSSSAGDHFDHAAILGSRETADEFDRLPPDEAKRRLGALAVTMDTDQNGRVDREELVRWILRSFKLLSEEDAAERHEESDTNGDGFVTLREYVDENYDGIDPLTYELIDHNGTTDQVDRRMLMEDRQLFNVSDVDDDGQLSRSEFSSFAHPEEFEHTARVLAKNTMDERDGDRDGLLTLDEYLGGEDAKGKDIEWRTVEKDRFEHDYDVDGDGRLSEDEVLAWLTPDETDSAEQEADHLMEIADTDLDGSLTIQEVVDHHEDFVGSEATDFGGHLVQNLSKFKEEL